MTDEEIEKCLMCMRGSGEDCKECHRPVTAVLDTVIYDALDYINRLKEKNNTLEQNLEKFGMVYTGMLEFQDKLKSAAVEKAKKGTAKEILQEVFDIIKIAELYDTTNITVFDIKVIAKKYGVEVDDE